jgi:hypothetical protein
MRVLSIALALPIVVGLGIVGWLCVTRPSAVAEWHGRRYPNYPRLISTGWFPAYLRFMGIFVWLFAVLIVCGLFGKLP